MKTLAEFADQLAASIRTVAPRLDVGLDKVGILAQSIAAELPGHDQPHWAPLAASTLLDKERRGFPVPSPLKRTGEMSESYHKELVPSEFTVIVGSTDKVALYQEMGTSRIPPRTVLKPALERSLPYASDVFGEIAVSILTGRALFK